MRLSSLRDKRIRTLEGEMLGRIHEVHCDKGKIVALMCGPGSLIERWTARNSGRSIRWESVVRIERDAIVVKADVTRRRTKS
jgi:sporulation protein YlmC with PRC-barrel domain